MATVGLVIDPPATTGKASLVTTGVSVVVVTVSVFEPAVPLVMPRRVIRSWWLAPTAALEKNAQVTVSALLGLLQKPTSVALVMSRTSAPAHVEVFVPAGRTSVMPLPASADRPPVAETLKVMT